MLLNFSLNKKKLTLSYTIYFYYYYYTKKMKKKNEKKKDLKRYWENQRAISTRINLWFENSRLVLYSWLGSGLPDHCVNMIYISLPTFSKQKLAFSKRNLSFQGQIGLWSHQEHHYNLVQNVFSEVIDWWNANDIYWIL